MLIINKALERKVQPYGLLYLHQICNWAKYHKFTFYVVTFMLMKMHTLSAPQNDLLNLIFVKDVNISVHISIGSKIMT